MATNTFTALFESQRESLKSQLEGFFIPNDAAKIQQIVGDYLSQVFDKQGEMRMALTQSEDYILQAALTLLNAQQKMAIEFASMQIKIEQPTAPIEAEQTAKGDKSIRLDYTKQLSLLTGTAVGGVGGALLLNTWGAVFGSIAGTALVLYSVKNTSKNKPQSITAKPTMAASIVEKEINADVYLDIVQEICASIDALIATYRAQIKRVVNKYESQEKPTLEKDYRLLLENIQSLIGYERTHGIDEKSTAKLKERIENLAELLENYDLQVVDYNGENEQLFEMLDSASATESKMVYPALIKDGRAVLKGRVFVKSNQ